MPPKAKKKKTSRVSPPITTNPKFVDYEALYNGDAFLYNKGLWMKCENDDQEAINLDNGDMETLMCDSMVEVVDITVAWKKK